MAEDRYETHEYDVVVIGAGGAGLRAATECGLQGLNTGLVCKSLLGKAHTVMAEGGCAAALGNVAPKDNWKAEDDGYLVGFLWDDVKQASYVTIFDAHDMAMDDYRQALRAWQSRQPTAAAPADGPDQAKSQTRC